MRSAFVKPDVAGTIERARLQQDRARELRRIAEEALGGCLESRQRLTAVRWLARSRAAAPAAPHPVSDMIARESG
jgi:hypothetical protein